MLLRFGVENYLSIRDYQEINLTATKLTDDATDLINRKKLPSPLLPSIAIYGANASGKSNLISAFYFMIRGILHSYSHGKEEKGAPLNYFRLDNESKTRPCKFDIDFFHDEVRYHYGYSMNDKVIQEEWLYAYPHGKRQIWFYRNIDESPKLYFGKNLKGKLKTIEELTKPNSLFLSTAAEANHDQLSNIYKYFENRYEVYESIKNEELNLKSLLEMEEVKKLYIDFLKEADIGILDIKVEEKDFDVPDDVMLRAKEFESAFNQHTKLSAKLTIPEKREMIFFGHKAKDREPVYFPPYMESDGTLALLSLLRPVFYALATGSILFIDEIESSLHPLLSNKIIRLFNKSSANLNGAQIIFTTHDTNLLANDFLRRDQVWFTEKNSEGATHIFPLSDIKTRKGDNLEKGYLQGRFGAIPYLGSFEKLFSNEED
jgi:uncharacterized protein